MQQNDKQKIRFTKMHGLGNDFVMVDGVTNNVQLSKEIVAGLAHRQFGIGFDQLLLVEPPAKPDLDFNYRIFNVDGGEVEHCGNGARCFAAYVYDQGLSTNNPLSVGTVNRTLSLHTLSNGEVTVDMGIPDTKPQNLPFVAQEETQTYQRRLVVANETVDVEFGAISMGNPHAVIKVADLDNTAVKEIGEALGAHPDFPEGVNVGFMEILDRAHIKLRVFERGTGETLACGTGACAAVVTGQIRGLLDENVNVQLPGGQLNIQWKEANTSVLMTGPVSKVYEGTIEL
ncbi:MAG: diaminopimelate epimerase [Pseudohongiellaceae bacterium]